MTATLFFVKAEAAELIIVDANTRAIISGVVEMFPSIEALKNNQTTTIKRTRTAMVVVIVKEVLNKLNG